MSLESKDKKQCPACDLFIKSQRKLPPHILGLLRFVLGRHTPQMYRPQVAATLLLEVSPVSDVSYSEALVLALWTIERSKYTCIFRI